MSTPKHTPNTVGAVIDELVKFESDAIIRFSVADNSSGGSTWRLFCEQGIHDAYRSAPGEVTVCLVGYANLKCVTSAAPELAECLRDCVAWHRKMSFEKHKAFTRAAALLERLGM